MSQWIRPFGLTIAQANKPIRMRASRLGRMLIGNYFLLLRTAMLSSIDVLSKDPPGSSR
jgi:hypothetical protein